MDSDSAEDYSDETLEGTPERVTKFLTGIGAVPEIRTLLFQAGMEDAEIKEGRQLLLACLAKPQDPESIVDTEEAKAQRAAVAELDNWDEPNFARYKATLHRHFRSACDYVFHNLTASTGVAAVQGVATFLTRVVALDNGSDPARQSSKKDDKKAVELLAKRGLTKAERTRLQKLVDVALGPTKPLEAVPAPADRRQALVELRGWFDEWSTTARAVIKKRSYLIRLGLAARRSTEKQEEPENK